MPENATFTMKVKVPPKGQGQNKRAKHRAKITGPKHRAKIEGKGKGKTTNYYFPSTCVHISAVTQHLHIEN